MKQTRSVLRFALLCAAIMALGFLAPELYGQLSPDFKNEPESVPLADTNSPIYIVDGSSLTLPPWEQIDIENSIYYHTMDADERYEEFLDDLLRSLVTAFAPDGPPREDVMFFEALRFDSENGFLFLKDFRYKVRGLKGLHYTADIVLNRELMPCYVHILPAFGERAPAEEPEKLADSFRTAISLLESKFIGEVPSEAESSSSAPLSNDYSLAFSDFFESLLWCYRSYDGSYLIETLPGREYQSLVYTRDFLTLTYENETLIVMTDVRGNPCTLFFDGSRNVVTGFGMTHDR